MPIGWEDRQPLATPPVLPYYKQAMQWIKEHGEPVPSPSPTPVPILQIFMLLLVSNYNEEFLELTSFANKT